MAKPSTVPAAESCAEPTCTGGVWGPAVCTINDAFPAIVRSIDAVKTELAPAGSWGNVSGSGSVPLGSPNKLSRAVAASVPLFTSVNHIVQFSSAATWGIEPTKLSPETG